MPAYHYGKDIPLLGLEKQLDGQYGLKYQRGEPAMIFLVSVNLGYVVLT